MIICCDNNQKLIKMITLFIFLISRHKLTVFNNYFVFKKLQDWDMGIVGK